MTEFAQTLMTSDDLTFESLSKSQIVLLMFGSLWGLGLIAIASYWAHQTRKRQEQLENKFTKGLNSKEVVVDTLTSLENYLEESFPSVYQSQSYLQRMIIEISKNHPYIDIFSVDDYDPELKKIISFIKLLTELTMFMFMLAAFYELEVT